MVLFLGKAPNDGLKNLVKAAIWHDSSNPIYMMCIYRVPKIRCTANVSFKDGEMISHLILGYIPSSFKKTCVYIYI